ncbi:hypothetical protein BCR34DRAFT_589646 [Clohesyomyces aquaticus]|uniref:Uncharacterized protein n=1 Tax=Clohesyomyces aquaticus TaxID=1231657 RepID=A0A1Y1ZFD4_9PLEO|nr:hypothetical protein BCR34DRAFT_589646 [Clohesyomyces aquaticus]
MSSTNSSTPSVWTKRASWGKSTTATYQVKVGEVCWLPTRDNMPPSSRLYKQLAAEDNFGALGHPFLPLEIVADPITGKDLVIGRGLTTRRGQGMQGLTAEDRAKFRFVSFRGAATHDNTPLLELENRSGEFPKGATYCKIVPELEFRIEACHLTEFAGRSGKKVIFKRTSVDQLLHIRNPLPKPKPQAALPPTPPPSPPPSPPPAAAGPRKYPNSRIKLAPRSSNSPPPSPEK